MPNDPPKQPVARRVRRRPWRGRVVLASDLGLDLDATPHGQGESMVFLDGLMWGSQEGEPAPGSARCPVCQGRQLEEPRYCSRCDAYWLDGQEDLPGLPVGGHPDPAWKPDPKAPKERKRRRHLAYRPGRLKGGRG